MLGMRDLAGPSFPPASALNAALSGRCFRRGVRRRAKPRRAGTGGGRGWFGAHHPECPATSGGAFSSPRSRARANSRACLSLSSSLRIVRASGGGRRGGVREDANADFVLGREEELGLLSAPLAARLRGAHGQLVLVVGEPGLGKSPSHRGVPPHSFGRNPSHLGRMERLATVAEHAAASNR